MVRSGKPYFANNISLFRSEGFKNNDQDEGGLVCRLEILEGDSLLYLIFL